MKRSFFNQLTRCVPSLAAALLCAAALVARAAEAETNAVVVSIPRSVFVDDVQQGRDPFFPDSVRRLGKAPIPGSTNVTAPIAVASPFSLKGITGSKLQPLALINNATLSAGEAAEVRAAGQTYKIRCREIRARSVIIEVDGTGEIRELKLREGI